MHSNERSPKPDVVETVSGGVGNTRLILFRDCPEQGVR